MKTQLEIAEEVLKSIAEMPNYDQDDAFRLREKAKAYFVKPKLAGTYWLIEGNTRTLISENLARTLIRKCYNKTFEEAFPICNEAVVSLDTNIFIRFIKD